MNCCVIDDEPLAGKLIAGYVERTPSLNLRGLFTSAKEAYATIAAGDIDLVFLDIQMPELSGMEFVSLLPQSTMVVFVTAYENYAIEGLRADAVDYLLKPVNYQEFLNAVGRASERHNRFVAATDAARASMPAESDRDSIIVKSEYRHRQIRKADILYIEGLKDYVKICIERESKSVMSLLSMKGLEQTLADSNFMRVHRSFIVNLDKIHTIERNRLLLADRSQTPPALIEIPIGDSCRPSLAAFIASRSLD